MTAKVEGRISLQKFSLVSHVLWESKGIKRCDRGLKER